jgi:hypothetical protein
VKIGKKKGISLILGTLKITRPDAREYRWKIVDKGDGKIFGDLTCEGFLGKVYHTSSSAQRWTLGTRRQKCSTWK